MLTNWCLYQSITFAQYNISFLFRWIAYTLHADPSCSMLVKYTCCHKGNVTVEASCRLFVWLSEQKNLQ